MTTRSKTYEFKSPSPALSKLEKSINKELAARYPGFGPVQLFEEEKTGGIAFHLSMRVKPGQKAVLDEVYTLITTAIGQRRGRKRGEKKVQVKLRLSEQVRDKVKAAADRSHSSLSDVIETCLRERYG